MRRDMFRIVARSLVICVVIDAYATACATQPTLRERLDELPIKHLSFYDFDPAVPLIDRVTDAPNELLSLYADTDGTPLHAYRPSGDERAKIGEVFDRLPARHREVLEQRLIGVYCVENFAGSGMADYIIGPGDALYAVLILHPRVFEMDASELLTYRANTAFRQEDSDIELIIDVSEEVSGLAYIMLHETTHIVDYVERHTPYVEPGMYELFGRSGHDTSFTDEVWEDYRVLGSSVDFVYQPELRFYGIGDEPKLSNIDLPSTYQALSQTPFASLYASISWAEDFAEFVTFYYLVHALGARYEIRIERAGKSISYYEPMSSSVVLDRAALIDPELVEPPRSAIQ